MSSLYRVSDIDRTCPGCGVRDAVTVCRLCGHVFMPNVATPVLPRGVRFSAPTRDNAGAAPFYSGAEFEQRLYQVVRDGLE